MFTAARIKLEGIVQGVGFRPFIHRLSQRFRLVGFAANTSSGVEIEVEGEKQTLINFYQAIQRELPALARITKKDITFLRPRGYKDFTIRESKKTSIQSALVSPDIAICNACRKELLASTDRRHLYPFINCTDCGPRFSIIQGLPYDRPLTTMKKFKMCPVCQKEYQDIANRRYHAQPNACSVCGPQVELIKKHKITKSPACPAGRQRHREGKEAIYETIKLLKQGKIVAIKGIGGFHIACDAYNLAAVKELRRRKSRPSKPFAIMVRDIREAAKICTISSLEKEVLSSPEQPIVLLKKKINSKIYDLLAPDNNYLGVMLAYAPLHHLLFCPELSDSRPLGCLVATSANIADEPIETENYAAMQNLSGVCDYFLVNNRDIYNRVDDSIVQVMDKKAILLRRGRGYSPFPFLMDTKMKEILGCGAELKNTACLSKDKFAFLSQYIGDLKTYSTFNFYKETIRRLDGLFAIKPKIIACDLHPDYLSTKYARELKAKKSGLKLMAVQHHQAHLASVIAEQRIRTDVIGICFDGIGFGPDAKIWGGEIFTGNLKKFNRVGHLEYIPMPGGDQATQEPYRMAISYLYKTFGENIYKLKIPFIARHKSQLHNIIQAARINPIYTSSIGRLFDAVSALLGICDIITYEAQGAIRLQMFAERSRTQESYNFTLKKGGAGLIIKTDAVIRQIISDLKRGISKEDIAFKFHKGIAKITLKICSVLRKKNQLNSVAISGGVFQNKLLLETLVKILRQNKFKVYYNELLPTNDGAISLGQVAIANATNGTVSLSNREPGPKPIGEVPPKK
jgi:hydrogenase maturation protein HypF